MEGVKGRVVSPLHFRATLISYGLIVRALLLLERSQVRRLAVFPR